MDQRNMTSIVYYLSCAELLNVARPNAKFSRTDVAGEDSLNKKRRRWRRTAAMRRWLQLMVGGDSVC
jgi:hypothetical protein